MRRLCVTLLSVAGLTLGLAAAVPGAASAGAVGITPPAVGSCHDLSWREVSEPFDRDPAVDCADRHTTVTLKVKEFDDPDWWDDPATGRTLAVGCHRAMADYFRGSQAELEMSSYRLYYFYPTKAQREAGAQWARCDLARFGVKNVPALPTEVNRDLSTVPVGDQATRCVTERDGRFWWSTCERKYQFRAKTAAKYAGGRYPGEKKVVDLAIKKCRERITYGSRFFFSYPTKYQWSAGWRHAVCYQRKRPDDGSNEGGGGAFRSPTPRTIPAEVGVLPDPGVHRDRGSR